MARLRRRAKRAWPVVVEPEDVMALAIGPHPRLGHRGVAAESARLRELWRRHGRDLTADPSFPWALRAFGDPRRRRPPSAQEDTP